MIIAVDSEQVLEAEFTRHNTRAGDWLTMMFKYKSQDATRVAKLQSATCCAAAPSPPPSRACLAARASNVTSYEPHHDCKLVLAW